MMTTTTTTTMLMMMSTMTTLMMMLTTVMVMRIDKFEILKNLNNFAAPKFGDRREPQCSPPLLLSTAGVGG